jgi:hypothetical protein
LDRINGGQRLSKGELENNFRKPCDLQYLKPGIVTVSDKRIRNIPEVVVVRRGAVGFLGIWRRGESWVKGGANEVSLQAT